MALQKRSLLHIVSYLNDETSDGGGFWLPNIQRPFVWKEEQIYSLFDSILRKYPISTLLVWKTRQQIRCRKFIDIYNPKQGLSNTFVPDNENRKCIVLDGQQRLQSLLIGLKGSYDGKELFLNVLGIGDNEQNEYGFIFVNPDDKSEMAIFPRVRFRDIIFAKTRNAAVAHILDKAEKVQYELSDKVKHNIADLVDTIFTVFSDTDGISYQELDGTDYQASDKNTAELYNIDDVVEIFIRVNSGGTKLSKSDLLFSLLASDWYEVTEKMEEFLTVLNRPGYEFDQDFILKSCLTLLDKQARYHHKKFRDADTRNQIQQNWDNICKALSDVIDFLFGKTFVRNNKALPSPSALIPVAYLRYHYGKKALSENETAVREYLIRTLLSGSFSSGIDYLIDKLVDKIKELQTFDLAEMFGVVQDTKHNLGISENQLLSMGYGHENNSLLFSLWYGTNYNSAYSGNKPQVDHIFPQSVLKKVTEKNPETKRDRQKYSQKDRDKLANCMLLTAEENSRKNDTLPCDWFKGKSPEYLELHLIPNDPALWELDRFEDFIAEREKKIKEKFSYLLVQSVSQNN
jgi:5-methylcytosine-specific restriction endonuclease McrA